ncbi:MAG: NADH-quinone oxidoreductase subunit C [Candidatus Aenigmarchaeota archaeon]|nr:NADH-quinone oxidoreductase subunit C [Candidatus Aenigmarchaeota archaeon]MCK4531336.1 NADH-quinone oxidoreductase subunit C [Candidatus Aenigmarchaeota archaeon]
MHVESYLKRMRPKKEGENLWISLERKKLLPTLKDLKSLGVSRVSSISGVDEGKTIDVIYHFIHKKKTINFRISLDKKNCVVDSITDIYPGANLFERELYEMMGVQVKNHPNLKKLFLDKNSPKNPLRRS